MTCLTSTLVHCDLFWFTCLAHTYTLPCIYTSLALAFPVQAPSPVPVILVLQSWHWHKTCRWICATGTFSSQEHRGTPTFSLLDLRKYWPLNSVTCKMLHLWIWAVKEGIISEARFPAHILPPPTQIFFKPFNGLHCLSLYLPVSTWISILKCLVLSIWDNFSLIW